MTPTQALDRYEESNGQDPLQEWLELEEAEADEEAARRYREGRDE